MLQETRQFQGKGMKISVIIPVYNCAPWLRKALRSLWESSKQVNNLSIELICIDDASTDISAKILEEEAQVWGESLKLIKLKKNGGLGAARNRGLFEITGDWFLFVDADDFVTPDFFEKIVQAIKESNASMICYALQCVDENTNDAHKTGNLSTIKLYDLSKQLEAVPAYMRISSEVVACNVCYKRDLGKIRFESITPGEDNLFIATAFVQAKSIAFFQNKIYCYRQRKESLMHRSIVSVKQIESAGLSMLGRVLSIKNLPYFGILQPFLRKSFGQTYILILGDMLHRVSKDNRKEAWETYWQYGKAIITSIGLMPQYLQHIFSKKSIFLWYIALYLPWKIKSILIQIPLIKRLRLRRQM